MTIVPVKTNALPQSVFSNEVILKILFQISLSECCDVSHVNELQSR